MAPVIDLRWWLASTQRMNEADRLIAVALNRRRPRGDRWSSALLARDALRQARAHAEAAGVAVPALSARVALRLKVIEAAETRAAEALAPMLLALEAEGQRIQRRGCRA